MDSEVDSGNGTAAKTPATELPSTAVLETERTVEAEAEPKKEAEQVADHPLVAEFAAAAETTISETIHSPMASKVHSGNGTAVGTEQVADHLPVAEFAPAAETTISETIHSPMASKVHSGNGTAVGTPETETESEIPTTALEVAPEKEMKTVADCTAVTELTTAAETTVPKKKRRGLAGDCLFRVIVPVLKYERIFGRNGDLIRKICEETKAHIGVLEGPAWHPYHIVLISGKEEIEPPLSPAMDAVIRVFKCINGFPENESGGVTVTSIPFCSIRLLLTSMQAMSLIEKQGSSIKTIQENTRCSVCIRSSDEVSTLSTNSDDRIIDLQGEGLGVLQALEGVLEHLRMLLIDLNIPPLFKETHETTSTQEKHKVVTWVKKSIIHSKVIGRDPMLSTKCSPGFDCTAAGPSVTQVTHRMQMSRRKAVDIIGVEGTNNENKGTPPQVKAARQLLENQVKTVQNVALKAIETKPVVPVSSDNSNVMQTRPEQAGPTVLDGMEHMSESKRSRVSWEDEDVVKTFLDACIHEIAITGREGRRLRVISWKKVGEVLKDRHNFSVDRKQMKKYFRGLMSKYRSWLILKDKIDNIYDPSTNMFNLTDKMTEINEKKKNEYIETLRNASLPFPDLCAQLFDGVTFMGITCWGPSFAKHIPETNNQKDAMSLACPSFPVKNKKRNGEVTHEPQAAIPLVPPSAPEAPVEPQKEPKRSRYLWNDEIVKAFLDACIHEIAINGRESGSLKAVSWKKVGEMLEATHNFSVDSKQMKNYFDGLKSKYIAWLSLKNKLGNKYDPSTNTFNLTEKEWGTEMKKNKCIEELRMAPLRFPDLCTQLFDGAISTGSFQTGVDQALTRPESGELTDGPQSAVPLIPPSAATEAPEEPHKEPMVEVPPELPQLQPASELVAIETKGSMSVFEEILGALKMIADKVNKPEPSTKPTFGDCEKKLNELGWPQDDPLHEVAFAIFCDENDIYRECWMKLKPERCSKWVRMIGRSKGFI